MIEGRVLVSILDSASEMASFSVTPGQMFHVRTGALYYVENIGDTTLRFLEIFRSDHFADISLAQWLAFTPHELVKAHLNIDESVLDTIPKQKTPVVPR